MVQRPEDKRSILNLGPLLAKALRGLGGGGGGGGSGGSSDQEIDDQDDQENEEMFEMEKGSVLGDARALQPFPVNPAWRHRWRNAVVSVEGLGPETDHISNTDGGSESESVSHKAMQAPFRVRVVFAESFASFEDQVKRVFSPATRKQLSFIFVCFLV